MVKNNKEIKIEESKVNFFEEIREISEKNETENTILLIIIALNELSENNMSKFMTLQIIILRKKRG